MLTQEKAAALMEYLAKDEATAKALAEMDAADAAKELKANGLEFTAEELAEFADGLKKATEQKGELDEAALEGVSGGAFRLWWIDPPLPVISILPYILWKKR